MKKTISFLLALLMAASTLAACAADPTPAEDTTAAETTAVTAPVETGPVTDEWGRELIEDAVPADLKYDGDVLRIFHRDDEKYLLLEVTAPADSGDVLSEAVYKRNLAVEERLGIRIETKSMPGMWAVRLPWFNVLRSAVQANDDSIDMATVYLSQGASLITEGLFLNLLDVEYLDLEKPWWNQDFTKEMTLFDQLYSVVGDYLLGLTTNTVLTFFNKNLLAEIYPNENMYQVVYDGKWTLDYMKNLTGTVYSDLNGNGARDDADRYGYRTLRNTIPGDSWPVALGINTTRRNADGLPELCYYSERTVNAFEKLESLYSAPGTNVGNANFAAGNVLFECTRLLMTDSLRDMEEEYGILPMPKFDEAQEEYATIPQNSHSMVTITKTTHNAKMVGAAVELLGAESYRQVKPVFFETAMKSKYLRSSDDAKMFDLIMENVKFNFGYVWSATKIGNIAQLMRDPSINLASTYASKEKSYKSNLDKLLAQLEALAYAQ